jgi:hypothetical protein
MTAERTDETTEVTDETTGATAAERGRGPRANEQQSGGRAKLKRVVSAQAQNRRHGVRK